MTIKNQWINVKQLLTFFNILTTIIEILDNYFYFMKMGYL